MNKHVCVTSLMSHLERDIYIPLDAAVHRKKTERLNKTFPSLYVNMLQMEFSRQLDVIPYQG